MRIKLIMLMIVMPVCLSSCGKKFNSQSIENRDYALDMKIDKVNDGYVYSFNVADLTDYKGGGMKTKEYEYESSSLMSVMKMYFEENERQLDIGHIEKIKLSGSEEEYIDLFEEFSEMTYLPKSVTVLYGDGESEILRKLIANNIGKKGQ